MAFPDVPRVIYQKTPSEEVISQVRFPAVLKIDTGPPSAQERVRGDYAFYDNQPALKLAEGMPPDMVGMLAPLVPQMANHFDSRDEKWPVVLTREFLTLAGRPYYHRFYMRVGLRPRDVMDPAPLGLESLSWTDHFQPRVAGACGSCASSADVELVGLWFGVIHQ
jgi:hypothetical protein